MLSVSRLDDERTHIEPADEGVAVTDQRADRTTSTSRGGTPAEHDTGPVAPDHGSAARLLSDRARLTPDRPILAERTGDTWTGISAADVLARVRGIAKGFVAAGLQPGAHVAILSRTRMEWTLVDFAVWTAGLVSVPVYETSAPDQIRHILSDSESVAIVVEKEEHARRVAGIAPDLPHLGQHWTIDGGGLDDLTRLGEDVSDAELDGRTATVSGRDDATIIYTSGTTGRPKGCVLRHDNFTATVENSTEAMSEVVSGDASTLLFIPMAHVFARFIAAMSVSAGVLVGHEPDTKDLLKAVSTFKPTFLLAVPRVFEKIYNSSEQKADLGGKGRVFRAAAATAVAHSEAVAAGRVPFGLALRFRLFDKLVYAKLRDALGGRVRYAISGSAPLSPRLSHFFRSIGVHILEGYGLTETTAPATVNRATEPPDRHRRPGPPRRRGPDRRRPGDPHPWRRRLRPLLAEPGGDRRRVPGRLVPYGRPRPARPGRRPHGDRAGEGASSSRRAARTSRRPRSRTPSASTRWSPRSSWSARASPSSPRSSRSTARCSPAGARPAASRPR